jgi:hypothetical protein
MIYKFKYNKAIQQLDCYAFTNRINALFSNYFDSIMYYEVKTKKDITRTKKLFIKMIQDKRQLKINDKWKTV